MSEKAILVQAIEQIFPCLPVCSEVISHDGAIMDEPRAVEKLFKGKAWCDISLSMLINDFDVALDSIFIHMSDEAKRYYLPLFLIICLKEYEECDVMYESVMDDLVYRDNSYFPFVEYSDKQKKIVAQCLQYFAVLNSYEDDFFNDAKKALNSYWKGYLN